MKYTRDWLINQIESDVKIKYLFFWGHKPMHDGTLSTTCFSQWWAEHPFIEDNITYLTAEHYMMAGKARLFGDEQMLQAILQSKTAGEAKKLGRNVRNFEQEIWKQHRTDIVIKGNLLKFSQHETLGDFLINTKYRIIVEASPRDRIWGIGMSKEHEAATDPTRWRGANLLGFSLMEVRDRLNNSTTIN